MENQDKQEKVEEVQEAPKSQEVTITISMDLGNGNVKASFPENEMWVDFMIKSFDRIFKSHTQEMMMKKLQEQTGGISKPGFPFKGLFGHNGKR